MCIGYNDNFLILQFGDCRIRVLSSHFISLNIVPIHKPLEHVKFLNSKKVIEFGMIKGIHWHNNEQKFYYDIEVNGKMNRRRYSDADLEKIE